MGPSKFAIFSLILGCLIKRTRLHSELGPPVHNVISQSRHLHIFIFGLFCAGFVRSCFGGKYEATCRSCASAFPHTCFLLIVFWNYATSCSGWFTWAHCAQTNSMELTVVFHSWSLGAWSLLFISMSQLKLPNHSLQLQIWKLLLSVLGQSNLYCTLVCCRLLNMLES